MSLDNLLDRLPSSANYEFSFMHQTTVSHVIASSSLHTVATISVDGIVKFWKKTEPNIELLRSFRCHTKPITTAFASSDERYFVTCSSDRTIKIFDLMNCELIHFIDVEFEPSHAILFQDQSRMLKVVCLERDSSLIRILDPFDQARQIQHANLHKKPIISVAYVESQQFFISVDTGGMLEYWDSEGKFPATRVEFQFKSQTDLYSLAKDKAVPYSMGASRNGKYVAILSNDFMLRIFTIASGRCVRKLCHHPTEMFADGGMAQKIVKLEQAIDVKILRNQSVIFDSTSHFVIYPTFAGIKTATVEANDGVFDADVGYDEQIRFVNLALYQGNPVDKMITIEMAVSENPAFRQPPGVQSCLFCTGVDKNRFYLITRNDPLPSANDPKAIASSRDIQNERIGVAKSSIAHGNLIADCKFVVLHTDMGDIKIELFPEKTPKAVTNFVTHCRNGYFNGLTFHRVVRDFMIQSGDPKGDGTGGSSIWGTEFEDEQVPGQTLDKAFMVCMANSGPNTNGSQFFITVVPTPWLNGKHTVFGRVVSGFETALKISTVTTNKKSKPLQSVCIRDVELKSE